MRILLACGQLRACAALFLFGSLVGCASDAPPPSALDSLRASSKASAERAASADARSNDYDSVMRVAKRAEKSNNSSIAIGLYQRAHEIDPRQPEPLLRLLSYYKDMGQTGQVTEAYRRLIEIEPEDPDHRLEYGLLLLRAEKTYLARKQFLSALALEEDVRSLNAAGVTFDMTGDRHVAQRHYRRALELDPEHLPSMGNLGLSLALSGEHQAAITMLEESVVLSEAGPQHRRMLATAYGLSGDMVAASRVTGEAFDDGKLRENLRYYGALDQAPE